MTDRDFQKILETLQVLDTDSISLYQRILEMSETALQSETANISFMKEQKRLNELFMDSFKTQENNNKIIFETLQQILSKLGESKNIMLALYKGLIITAFASVILIYFITDIFIGVDKLIINSRFGR